MFDILPEEMICSIIQYVDTDPVSIYKLRNVNKLFRKQIDILPSLSVSDYQKRDLQDKLGVLCKKKTSVKTFVWLYERNVFLDLPNLNLLIINNRIDVIKRFFHYRNYVGLLFNRFYLPINEENCDIFSLTKTNNPIMVAAIHNRVDMVSLLLELSHEGTSYHNQQLSSILNITIKYSHRNLLSYLVRKHYKGVFNDLQRKLHTIIHRFEDCEDLFFYLVVTKKVNITGKLLSGMIIQKYNDLFRYCYPMIQMKTEPDHHEYLKYCIYHSNKEIFTFLLTIIIPDVDLKRYIMNCLRQKRNNPTKEFLTFLLREHLSILEKHKDFIYLCIQHDVDTVDIMTLVNQEFPYDLEDIQLCLDKGNIKLLKYLAYHLKEDNISQNVDHVSQNMDNLSEE